MERTDLQAGKKERVSIWEGGRERSRWSGKPGAVKGGKEKYKRTINHLNIICPQSAGYSKLIFTETLHIFGSPFGKVVI